MKLADILDLTDRQIDLDPAIWAWAMLLGEARTRSNDSKRYRQSDRGEFNPQVDLLGALGELVLLRAVARAEDSAAALEHMRGHLFREAGGRNIKGPDLRFTDADTKALYELDVKTFDCEKNKKFFAINDSKHRSLDGQCSAYFCLATPRFGTRMAVARLVPYKEVSDWKVGKLFWRGTESRNYDIADFLGRHFTSSPSLDALREATFPMEEIASARANNSVRADLRALIPTLPIP